MLPAPSEVAQGETGRSAAQGCSAVRSLAELAILASAVQVALTTLLEIGKTLPEEDYGKQVSEADSADKSQLNRKFG